MELLDFASLIDKPNIYSYINLSYERLTELRENYSGTKQAYIDRTGEVMDELKIALADANEKNTAISVFQAIRASLVELNNSLGPQASENINLDRVREITDGILVQIPLLGLSASGTAKRRVRNELLEELTSEFRGYAESKKEELTGLVDEIGKTVRVKQDEFLKNGAEREQGLLEKINGIEKLAELVSGRALSNEFSKQAVGHRTGKWIWTGITGLSAAATFGWLGIFLYAQLFPSSFPELVVAPPGSSSDYSVITTKILITLTLGLFTRWASKRANHHLAEQTRYRRLALNMDTLNSFVGDLDVDNKNKVIAFVAARTLSDYPSEDADVAFDAPTLASLVKEISSKPMEVLPKG